MDKQDYVEAARAVRDANSPRNSISGKAAASMAFPGGGRRMLKLVAGVARRTEAQLRALEPPWADRPQLEDHFLRPWAEMAEYLEGLANRPSTWFLGPKGLFRLLDKAPEPRQEDVEFCIAYGLDDPPDDGQ